MKKLLSLFLACILLLGILPTSVFAADSVEEALGEVNIYNGDYELGYALSPDDRHSGQVYGLPRDHRRPGILATGIYCLERDLGVRL